MHLDLSNEEAAALTQELHDIVESDRYTFSPRIRTLRGIIAQLRPEPVREPLPPPPKVYAAASQETTGLSQSQKPVSTVWERPFDPNDRKSVV